MGWNAGFKIMEETVISLYDRNLLTREILDAVMQPYVDTDTDSGAGGGLKAADGLGAEEIICKVMEPEKYALIPVLTGDKPDCILFDPENAKYYSLGLELYRYDTWEAALKNKRELDVYGLWLEITRREWQLW